MITKTYKELTVREFLIKFFEIMTLVETNLDKKLTKREIEVLVEFIMIPENIRFNRFKQEGKNIVIKNFSERGERLSTMNVNMNIVHLRAKGYIVEDVDRIKQVHPNIQKYVNMALEDFEKGEFVFNFIFKR
jgi:plasmid replication initiation protein